MQRVNRFLGLHSNAHPSLKHGTTSRDMRQDFASRPAAAAAAYLHNAAFFRSDRVSCVPTMPSIYREMQP